jgi:DNA polymerase-1
MGIVRELEEMGIVLGPPNAQGVAHGPCPKCKGTDRFAVWVDKDTFSCNQCGISGGLRKFFEVVVGLAADEAAARARECREGRQPVEVFEENPNEVVDPAKWTKFVREQVESGEERLRRDPEAMGWLCRERGLTPETVGKLRLGLVRDFGWMWRNRCGLLPYQKRDGQWVKRFTLPDGIQIPYYPAEGPPVALQVRCWEATHGRYRFLPGSRLEAVVISFRPPARTDAVVVVESLLDAALIHQETAVPVVALGGTNAPLGDAALEAIKNAALVPLVMDSDDAGRKAARAFEAEFPNAVSCPVPDSVGQKDVTDAWRAAGMPVDKFITAALRRTAKIIRERQADAPRPAITTAPAPRADTAPPAPAPVAPHVVLTAPPAETAPPAPTPATSRERTYRHITDPNEAATEVRRIAAENDTLGVAIETAKLPEHADHPKAGTNPRLSRIRLVQVSGRRGDAILVDGPACGDELGAILAPLLGRRLVAHDGVRLMEHLLHAGVPVGTIECTMLMWNALTNEVSNAKDPTGPKRMALGLESVLHRSIGVELGGAGKKADWGCKMLPEALLALAAGRALHLVQLADALTSRLRMQRLEPVYLRMRDAQRAVARLELRGFGFDAAAHAALVARWRAEAEPLERRVRAIMGVDINLDSDKQKSEWLRDALPPDRVEAWQKTPGGLLSTAADVLEANADLEVAALLLRLGRLRTFLSTCGDTLAFSVSPVTGRLHTSFHLTGAITGRMSSSAPNLQSIPRDTEVRRLFPAGAGRALVGADFSQIDLRVAALLSGDEAMLDAYREGADLHRLTASRVLGIPPEAVTKEQRQMAKAVGFGTLYGQGGKGLCGYAKGTYHVELTLEQATSFQRGFFAAYPRLGRWRDDTEQRARSRRPVRTKGGRVRSFADDEKGVFTQSLNTPIQGTAGEIMLRALALVDERLEPLDAFIVNTVHDDILVECALAETDRVADALRECMSQAFLEMFPGAPTVNLVECGAGSNWAEAK